MMFLNVIGAAFVVGGIITRKAIPAFIGAAILFIGLW